MTKEGNGLVDHPSEVRETIKEGKSGDVETVR